MKPTKITDGIYDVGVTDWNIRDFHGYSTDRGTSYNAFLVIDEKVALIDTVKAPFADQLIGNISQIIDPKTIDVVISNHTEMDHSGALPRIMHHVGESKPANRIGGAFGSYGWSGEAVKQVAAELTAMNFNMVDPGPRLQYVPDSDGIDACTDFGKKIGQAVNAA
ncbi:MAG: MBL fold metallo-hydrolase [Desulfosarcina sp.]|jgi:flavorubredoxin